MEWHWKEALSIMHHLPHALSDLVHHESKALVIAGAPSLVKKPRIIKSVTADVAIDRDVDPAVSRSEQNFGLLVRDYLHNLPGYDSHGKESDALLEHWRKILLEQPQRLAEAHMDSWNSERSRQFWQEKLKHYGHDLANDYFVHSPEDWERMAGTLPPPPAYLKQVQSKKWQDLVISQRLHILDLDNMEIAHLDNMGQPHR